MKKWLLCAALLLLVGCTTTETTTPSPSVAATDNGYALNYTLKTLDGTTVSLSDYAGQVVVLNFWASWCPPCRAEMPELNELDKQWKESGDAVLLTINLTDGQRERASDAQAFIDETDYGFTVLLDEKTKMASDFEVYSIPQTFILDASGNIVDSIVGQTTASAVQAKVEAAR